MGSRGICEVLFSRTSPPRDGEGHEGGEGDEGHAAARHEEERDRQGQAREVERLQRDLRQDLHRAEEDRPDEEQERTDREQEVECRRQEGLQLHQGLDRGRDQGAQGARREGLRRCEEGDPPVQEGEGVLRQLSALCASQRTWRCSRTWGFPTACLSDWRCTALRSHCGAETKILYASSLEK